MSQNVLKCNKLRFRLLSCLYLSDRPSHIKSTIRLPLTIQVHGKGAVGILLYKTNRLICLYAWNRLIVRIINTFHRIAPSLGPKETTTTWHPSLVNSSWVHENKKANVRLSLHQVCGSPCFIHTLTSAADTTWFRHGNQAKCRKNTTHVNLKPSGATISLKASNLPGFSSDSSLISSPVFGVDGLFNCLSNFSRKVSNFWSD
jgi:hypothetical protein